MKILVIIGLALSLLGVVEAFNISAIHFRSEEPCPVLGPIPACYVVLVCYTLMALAWMASLFNKAIILKRGFWIGLIPALALAVLGVSGEIFGFAKCPRTSFGLPKCYISLGFVIIITLAWICPRYSKNSQTNN